MFKDNDLKLPNTRLTNPLQQAIPHEQFKQVANEVIRAMSKLKENFCKRMYYTLPEAQKQLHVLLTEVMMDKSGYVINEAIEEAEKELAKLKQI